MRTLLALLLLALALSGSAQTPEAKETKDASGLITRYFHFDSALAIGDTPEAPGLFPLIHDGLEKERRLRASDAQPFLAARGIPFPAGASAVYYHDVALIGVTNTPANLAKATELLRTFSADPSGQLTRLSICVIEYPLEAEDQLSGTESFEVLEKKLGLKTICTAVMTGPEGNQNIYDSDHPNRADKPEEPAGGKWPTLPAAPHIRVEAEFTRNWEPGDPSIYLTTNVHFAVPVKKDLPPMEDRLSEYVRIADGHFQKIRTFSLPGPDDALHCYAVLVRCDFLDAHGRTSAQRRAAFRAVMQNTPAIK
jgi:hypothetical protein